jgi:hypothetical protein
MFLNWAMNEDGSLPGESLPFLEGVMWFFVLPVSITLLIVVLVLAQENVKKARSNRFQRELLTRIDD